MSKVTGQEKRCAVCGEPGTLKEHVDAAHSRSVEQTSLLPRGSMHFAFLLSMPGNNAWNGKWTGEGRCYARVKSFTARGYKEKLSALVGDHRYSFGDGWVARVEVKVVTSDEKRKLLKRSLGFCGYDWMIDSLISHGEIRA